MQFVRWVTAGGYPLVVFAPYDLPSSYRLTQRAFDVYRLSGVASRASDEIEIPAAKGMRREHAALYGIARLLEHEGPIGPEALGDAIRAHGFRGANGRELDAQLTSVTR